MKATHVVKRIISRAFLSGGVALAGFGLAAGPPRRGPVSCRWMPGPAAPTTTRKAHATGARGSLCRRPVITSPTQCVGTTTFARPTTTSGSARAMSRKTFGTEITHPHRHRRFPLNPDGYALPSRLCARSCECLTPVARALKWPEVPRRRLIVRKDLRKLCAGSIIGLRFFRRQFSAFCFTKCSTEEATMSLVSIAPDVVAAASGNLADLGSALRSANAAAATQTISIAAPAADEVSAAITALLGTHAQGFQALSAKAAAFHDDFVNLLNGGAAQYVGTEVASSNTFSGKFGPLSYSLTESATSVNGTVALNAPLHPALAFSATQTSSGVDLNATGTFNTPLGTVKWLTATGSATTSGGGAFQASINAHTPFAPTTSLSVNGTPISSGGVVGETVTATGTFNTPLGPVTWLTANGSASLSPNGAFQASISAHTPGVHEGASVTGTIASGTPQITGVSINFDGFRFSF